MEPAPIAPKISLPLVHLSLQLGILGLKWNSEVKESKQESNSSAQALDSEQQALDQWVSAWNSEKEAWVAVG